jgi:hypothetical protein
VSATEELVERESSGSGVETEIIAVGIRRADYATLLYPQKSALTSPKSCGRSVGLVRSRTQATEFVLLSPNCALHILKLFDLTSTSNSNVFRVIQTRPMLCVMIQALMNPDFQILNIC